jgi:hypothetical protein
MPRKKPRQSPSVHLAPKAKAKPSMPFSLILTPAEMAILRKEAARQGTSVGGVVRGAIHAALFQTHPEMARQLAEKEAGAFLDALTTLYPGLRPSRVKRAQLQRRIVSALVER